MHSRTLFTLPFALAALGVASAASAQDMTGEQLFKQRCGACHATAAGKPALMAPNLRGTVGRKAGSTDFKYSPALKADAKQRKAVIDWLGTQR